MAAPVSKIRSGRRRIWSNSSDMERPAVVPVLVSAGVAGGMGGTSAGGLVYGIFFLFCQGKNSGFLSPEAPIPDAGQQGRSPRLPSPVATRATADHRLCRSDHRRGHRQPDRIAAFETRPE